MVLSREERERGTHIPLRLGLLCPAACRGGAYVLLTAVAGLSPAFAESQSGEPWLDVISRARRIEVYRSGDRADAFLNVTLVNRMAHRVRIDDVRITFLSGNDVLRTERPGSKVLEREIGGLPAVLEERGRAEWSRICLVSPPEGADHARLELVLSSRKGSRKIATTLSTDFEVREAPPARSLRLPFDGYWRVTQGHTCNTNHRVGGLGGDYAWDLVAVDRGGKGQAGVSESRRNRDSQTFGQVVHAPLDGRVVRVVDDVADNEGLTEFPRRSLLEGLQRPEWVFGNFIVIDAGDGAYLLMAHLERGSISAVPGQSVRAGEPIARCGNSGNTFLSHLHVQVMDRPDPSDGEVRGIPARFTSYTEITAPADGTNRDVFIRRVASGDPPEESIVAPFYPDPPER